MSDDDEMSDDDHDDYCEACGVPLALAGHVLCEAREEREQREQQDAEADEMRGEGER